MSVLIVSGSPLNTTPIPDPKSLSQMLPSPVVGGHPQWYVIPTVITDAGRCSRTFHTTRIACSDLVLVYANFDEVGNPITVKCSIETPAGTFYPVHFGGETAGTVTIPAGATVRSQPLGISLAAGATFFVNTLVIPAASGSYPTSGYMGSVQNSSGGATDGGRVALGTTDYTGTTNPGTGSTQQSYGPVAVCGTPTSTALRAHSRQGWIGGDSISVGIGDSFQIGGLFANFESGWFTRAMVAAGIPFVSAGVNGSQGVPFVASSNSQNRIAKAMAESCSFAVWEWITNDLTNQGYTATIQPQFIAGWQQLAQRGPQVWATTCTPRTTSTDSWATIANQTAITTSPTGNFGPETSISVPLSGRQKYNAWLRDGAPLVASTLVASAVGTTGPTIARCATYDATGALVNAASGPAGHPLTGMIDVAAVCESWNSGNSTWVWNPTMGTTDGIHPGSAGHIAIVAAVPINALY